MEFRVCDLQGHRFLEGAPGQPFIRRPEDLSMVLEACFDNAARALLLYPENMTEHFFDLSSGEAGTILQKLRNYHIRLAIVRSPKLQLSRLFAEMIADESSGPYFGLFGDRAAAQQWLCRE